MNALWVNWLDFEWAPRMALKIAGIFLQITPVAARVYMSSTVSNARGNIVAFLSVVLSLATRW